MSKNEKTGLEGGHTEAKKKGENVTIKNKRLVGCILLKFG